MLRAISPWDGSERWQGAATDAASVADAVDDLAAAQDGWAARSAAERCARLSAFAGVLAERRDELVDALVHDAGKHRRDAEAEADLLGKKITVTCEVALARTPVDLDPVPPAGEARILWRPRGVAAVLGPFNFPLHLLHGLAIPALAVGCVVIAKPSERCPQVGARYREAVAAAGLDEVLRVVLGDAAVATAMVDQEAIATVAAVGGRAMGRSLAQRLAERPEVSLALELGGVNHALVCADADPAVALPALAEGAWRMAGQRCTATRIVHVPRSQLDRWCADLAAERQRWMPGDAIGPLIDVAARERFLDAMAGDDDVLPVIDGSLDADRPGALVEPLLLRVEDGAGRSRALYREEHFGPYLIIDPYDDEDEAVARMRRNPYRLAASVFTADRAHFAALARRLPYGQVNHDRQTAGARSDLPFGGCGRSGNGHPAALAAGRIFADECVVW